MPLAFIDYFPESPEPRAIFLDENNEFGLPPGTYIFEEEYCNTPFCDCRQACFRVKADWTPRVLAYMEYGWESPEFYKKMLEDADWDFDDPEDVACYEKEAADMAGVSFNIFYCRKTRYAEPLKSLFETRLLPEDGFVERLKRHYQMFRDFVDADAQKRDLSDVQKRDSFFLFGRPPKPKPKKAKKTKSKSRDALVLPEGFRIEKPVSPEIVRQALLSPFEAVRLAAADYFDGNDIALEIPDCGVMQTVMEAIEKYGYEPSLGMIEDRRFPQNEATVRRIVAELDKEHDPDDIPADNYCFFLAGMLCTVDPGLLSENMVGLRCFPKEKTGAFLMRLELAGQIWYELLRTASGFDPEYETEVWEAMARHTDQKETVLNALLGKDRVIKGNLLEDMTPNLIELVKDMKIVEALPWVSMQILTVEKYGFQSIAMDNMLELSSALAVIGDEKTLAMFCSRWLERPHKHPWFVDVLTRLKTPWSMNACLQVLQKRNLDENTRQAAIRHLAENFVSEALPMILAFDPELATDRFRRQMMVVAHLVNPIEGFDQFEEWKAEAERHHWSRIADRERYRYERIRDDYMDDDEEFDEEFDEDDEENFDGDEEDFGDDGDDENDDDFADDRDDESGDEGMEDDDSRDDGSTGDDELSGAMPCPGTIRNAEPHVGRNDPCPCGSGRKYKKCCLK